MNKQKLLTILKLYKYYSKLASALLQNQKSSHCSVVKGKHILFVCLSNQYKCRKRMLVRRLTNEINDCMI